eukprot:417906-Prymnesium_polylepis.1
MAEQPSAHSQLTLFVGFSPDGTKLLSGSRGSIKLWGRRALLVSVDVLLVLPAMVMLGRQLSLALCALAWGTDASILAVVAKQPSAHSDTVYSVGFSPDGTRIVSGSRDSSIKLLGAAHYSRV